MIFDLPYSLAGKRLCVAGATGMLGGSICRRLKEEDCEIVDVSRDSLNLCRQSDVENWMAETRPHAIFFAAGTVGGIHANDTRPGEFIYDNTAMAVFFNSLVWKQINFKKETNFFIIISEFFHLDVGFSCNRSRC